MKHALRVGRLIEHDGINYGIKIFLLVDSSYFMIRFYSSSKLELVQDKVREIIHDAFKINLCLNVNAQNRRSLSLDVTMDATFERVLDKYSKMKKCYIYGDKLIHNRRLNVFKNMVIDRNEKHILQHLLSINDDGAHVFFNGKLITKKSYMHDTSHSTSRFNSIGIFFNDVSWHATRD